MRPADLHRPEERRFLIIMTSGVKQPKLIFLFGCLVVFFLSWLKDCRLKSTVEQVSSLGITTMLPIRSHESSLFFMLLFYNCQKQYVFFLLFLRHLSRRSKLFISFIHDKVCSYLPNHILCNYVHVYTSFFCCLQHCDAVILVTCGFKCQ